MTIWEFRHLQNGFAKFNSGGEEGPKAPTMDEYHAALERFGVA